MSKAQAAKQPSIEDLLASIRQAIHDDVAPAGEPGPQHDDGNDRVPTAATGSESPDRTASEQAGLADLTPRQRAPSQPSSANAAAAQSTTVKRTIVTADREGFAGLLGGDVRLEEALARLSHAGRRSASSQAAEPARPAEQAWPAEQARPAEQAWPAEPARPAEQVRAAAQPAAPRLRPAIDEPVHRFQAQPHAAQPDSGHPPDPHNEPADAAGDAARDTTHPPWLRPEAKAAAAATSAADDATPRDGDPLWDDAPHRAGHKPSASSPDRGSDVPGSAASGPVGRDLLSAEAAASASSAFDKLADAIVHRSTGGERSLEDVTRELLRPMLKNWLDENLPAMVERLVREEIERVARKGK